MRKLIVYIIILIITLGIALSTFIVYQQNKRSVIGIVELTTKSNTYTSYPHWVYSLHDGLAADGYRFSKAAIEYNYDLSNGINELKEIPASDDFIITKIYKDGSNRKDILSYRVYDYNFEIIQNVNNITQIKNKGIYYIVASTKWGTEKDYAGYEYIFKVRVE